MNKSNRLILIFMLVALFAAPIQAFDKDLKRVLSSKELKRLESAEKLIAKGDAFINETKDLEKEVEQLKNADGRIKTGKINKRNKKIAQIKTKAALYYEDGYKKYIDVLDDHLKGLEKSGNSEAKQTRKDIKSLEKKARKQYNKAENITSSEKAVDLLELAQQNQREAIEIQTKCILNLSESIEEVPVLIAEEVNAVDSTLIETVTAEALPEQQDTIAITTQVPAEPAVIEMPEAPVLAAVAIAETPTSGEPTIVNEPETPVVLKTPVPLVVEEPKVINPDVFLTIQIMADKKKASNEQINSIYSGNKEVIEMAINDWYKYSVGKYQSIEKAKADMKSENIKGFIVAYNKNERISVKEAVTLLNGES